MFVDACQSIPHRYQKCIDQNNNNIEQPQYEEKLHILFKLFHNLNINYM